MASLYNIVRPLIFAMDAEKAHNATISALKMGLGPCSKSQDDEALSSTIWGKAFKNPIGLAAGFDKNADVILPMFKLGFGFVETGTVTPKPQEGNPKPRVFRAAGHNAVINRMGFPSKGISYYKNNVEKLPAQRPGIIGLNIGMNKEQTVPEDDYNFLVRELAPYADYLTVNISSPNTPGLRDLQKKDSFIQLINTVTKTRDEVANGRNIPLLVKLAPDLTAEQRAELANTVQQTAIDGIILGNTTLERPDYLPPDFREEKGGLSGKPLTDKATELVRDFYTLTKGRIPIIGCGGISNGQDAYDKIRAGASLIQIYSILAFKGPNVVQSIKQELLSKLKADGFNNTTEAIGADTDIKNSGLAPSNEVQKGNGTA